jgi:hypothetical protein
MKFQHSLFFLFHGLDGLGSIAGMPRFFSSLQYPDRLWGPPSLLSSGTGDDSLRVKRPGREADHSLPSSGEIKNSGAIPPLPHVSSWHSA